ncbi:MAG: pyridoxamine 5'-phosphate oxidase family protein [Thermoleophilia bacterium]
MRPPEPLATELLTAPHVATLATHDADGAIHAVAMWFRWDGDETIHLPTSGASHKVRNARRDPRATVLVHDSRGGLDVRGLTLAGRVEVLEGEVAAAIADAVHRRYVEAPGLALPPVADFLAHDDVVLALTIERASGWDETRTEAARALRASGAAIPPPR